MITADADLADGVSSERPAAKAHHTIVADKPIDDENAVDAKQWIGLIAERNKLLFRQRAVFLETQINRGKKRVVSGERGELVDFLRLERIGFHGICRPVIAGRSGNGSLTNGAHAKNRTASIATGPNFRLSKLRMLVPYNQI